MRLRLLALLSLPFLFWQCNGFLEEVSQTEIRPSTVRDMEKIIESDAYPSEANGVLFNRVTDIFTDDVKSNVVKDKYLTQKEEERYRFAWDNTMFDEGGGGLDISLWQVPYERIKGCNIVIEYADQMEGEQERIDYVKGEAHVLRGWYYYFLVNFFGLPYSYGDPATNAGVPLKLVTGVTDEHLKRNTVAECYNQILDDMRNGLDMMRSGIDYEPADLTRLTCVAVHGLLSRVYLHMEDWENVIAEADSVLSKRSGLLQFSVSSKGPYTGTEDATEILWASVESSNVDNQDTIPFNPSDELYNLYREDIKESGSDVRGMATIDYLGAAYLKTYQFASAYEGVVYTGAYGIRKCNIAGYDWNGGIRTAEVYLNRAEAYIRLYMEDNDEAKAQKALEDLNTLRRSRFEGTYVDWTLEDFENPQELLDFCLRERRRELCAEANHRWFDLRRTGMPELTHVYIENASGVEITYTLQKEDPRYVLPIPETVKERNPELR